MGLFSTYSRINSERGDEMRKYILGLMATAVLFASLIPSTAMAASTAGTYTAPGLFTTGIKVGKDAECASPEEMKMWADSMKDKREEDKKESETAAEDKENKFIEILMGPIGRAIVGIFGNDKGGGIIKGDCDEEYSFTKHLLKLTSPVKVTEFRPLMTFIKYIQSFSMVFLILFVVWYGFQYTIGRKEIQDPISFSFRMLWTIMGITFAPRLIQDLLNLNNIIVYYISQIPIPWTVDGAMALFDAGLGLGAALAIGNFIALTVASFFSGAALFLMILGMVILIMIIIPLIKIMVWWYVRLFTILLMTVFSPIFFLFYGSEETEKFAKKFFMQLIAEIFSQTFFVIGYFFAVLLIFNFGELGDTFDIGWIGLVLFLYVIIQMLAELPDMTKRWIGGASTPGFKQISNMVSAGVGAAIGAKFDKSLKKRNEKAALDKLKKDNQKQNGKINESLNNKDAFAAMNGGANGKTDSVLANMNKKQQEGGALNQDANKEKPSVLAQLKDEMHKDEQSEAAMQMSQGDKLAKELMENDLSTYSPETKDALIEGLKDGSLSRGDAVDMMAKDRIENQGQNSHMAIMSASDDRNRIENKHGVVFGQKNNVSNGKEMKLAKPIGQIKPNGEAFKTENQRKAEKMVANMKANELKDYSPKTQGQIINGLKTGDMSKGQAANLMAAERESKGQNRVSAATAAGSDANKLENMHGVTFGQKNSQLRTGREMSLARPVQPIGTFSPSAMGSVQNGLETGTMHRSQAVKTLADDLVTNKGIAPEKATQMAEKGMQKFEASSPVGLGYEAQSQLNKLAANGDLTQRAVQDIAKKDAMYHKGITDKHEVAQHVDSVMNKGKFDETVNAKSNREKAVVEKAPALNLGQGVRTSGGTIQRNESIFGEPTGSNYEIPNKANSSTTYSNEQAEPTESKAQTEQVIENPQDYEPDKDLAVGKTKKRNHSQSNQGNDTNPAPSGVVSEPSISGHHTASPSRETSSERSEVVNRSTTSDRGSETKASPSQENITVDAAPLSGGAGTSRSVPRTETTSASQERNTVDRTSQTSSDTSAHSKPKSEPTQHNQSRNEPQSSGKAERATNHSKFEGSSQGNNQGQTNNSPRQPNKKNDPNNQSNTKNSNKSDKRENERPSKRNNKRPNPPTK